MSTAEEKYQAVADHYRETSASHNQAQRVAFTKVDDAYRDLPEHDGNLLQLPVNFAAQKEAFEEAVEDYQQHNDK